MIIKKRKRKIKKQLISLSGNKVRSSYEVVFANFCFLNNIKFEYEKKLIEGRKFACDFFISNFYFEIWGYSGESRRAKSYIRKRKIKEKIYEDNNLYLVSIEKKLISDSNIEKINEELTLMMKYYKIKEYDFYNGDLTELYKTKKAF